MRTDTPILLNTHAHLEDDFRAALGELGRTFERRALTSEEFSRLAPEFEIMVVSGGSRVDAALLT